MTTKQMATIDHVKCKAQSSSWEEYIAPKNKVLACYLCNQTRNDQFLATFPESAPTWEVPSADAREILKRERGRMRRKEAKRLRKLRYRHTNLEARLEEFLPPVHLVLGS